MNLLVGKDMYIIFSPWIF